MLFEKGRLVLPASEVLGHIVGSVRSRGNLKQSVHLLDSKQVAHLCAQQMTYRVLHALNRKCLTLRERSLDGRYWQLRLCNLDAASRIQRLRVLGGNLCRWYRLHGRITRRARLHRVSHTVVALSRVRCSGVGSIGRCVFGCWSSGGGDVLRSLLDSRVEDVFACEARELEAVRVGDELTTSLSDCDHLDEAVTVELASC
jgi:hypothetical protein